MTDSKAPNLTVPPRFTRSEVAKILNCSSLTIYNREKSGKYPQPSRTNSNYRLYSLNDLFTLQKITYGQIYLSSIFSLLWDKGYTDVSSLEKYLNDALDKHQQGVSEAINE
jgi:hypothetical protein